MERKIVRLNSYNFLCNQESSMARHTPIERYRNIGISAHIDAGKTTLTKILAGDGQPAQVRLANGQVLRGTARNGGVVEITLP